MPIINLPDINFEAVRLENGNLYLRKDQVVEWLTECSKNSYGYWPVPEEVGQYVQGMARMLESAK